MLFSFLFLDLSLSGQRQPTVMTTAANSYYDCGGRRRPRLHNPNSGGRAVDVIQRCGEVHRRCHRPRVGAAATAGHTCARSSFGDWVSRKLSNKRCKTRTVAFEAGAWWARRQPLAGAALAAGGGRDLHTLVARGVRPHHERGRADHVPVVHDRMAQTLNLCTESARRTKKGAQHI